MTPAHALQLMESQERLERDGWRFELEWCGRTGTWSVAVRHPWDKSKSPIFARSNRRDALAQALQYAELTQEGVRDAG